MSLTFTFIDQQCLARTTPFISKTSPQPPSPLPATVQHGPHLRAVWQQFHNIPEAHKTQKDTQWGESQWVLKVWKNFCWPWYLEKTQIDPRWGETIWLYNLWEDFLSVMAPEDTFEGSQWGEELWMSAVWQSFLYSWGTQTSYSNSYRGEALCLLPLSEVLLSVMSPEDTL